MEFQLPEEVHNALSARGNAATLPRTHECLFCYLWRMVETHGCDGLLWAKRYQELCAPKDKALVQRLESHGGYCDCEVAMNVVVPHYLAWGPAPDGDSADDSWTDEEPEKPDCPGVRRGSTLPCELWLGNGEFGA